MSINILKYESEVWKTADLLIGAGIKQSDFPKYMMPFFALIMVESRLIREADRLETEVGRDDIEDFIEMFNLEGLGYNDFVIRNKKTLKTICQNDKSFDVDFHSYLKAFDGETKYLLGVDKGTEEEKFLDISGIAGQLKKKRILFDTVKAWSEIDLTPFNNSEITTLEEHIKRKWADISAETAGEQYTPDDIICLISEIIATKIEDNGKFLTIYDPTCGGGNLLFGVEDKIQEIYPNRPTATYGQEWNGTLFALAKIESRFRKEMDLPNRTKIVQTLTDFKDNEFAKVFDKWHFYYNRQSIMLTNIDENGKAIEMPVKVGKDGDEKGEKSIKLTPTKITQADEENPIEITEFDITSFDKTKYNSLENYFETGIKPLLAELDYKEKNLSVFTKDTSYYYDANKDTLIEQTKKEKTELGCGKIVIKASLKKDSKTKQAKSISITTELTQDLQKDYEIIPYSPDEATNQKNIADFMAKYVFKPFEYLDNVIGVEINFNKVFYTPVKLEEIATITTNLDALEKELKKLENDLAL